MVTLMNRLRQPLVFNLADGKSLYLLDRRRFDLTFENFMSTEIQIAVKNGDLMIVNMSEEAQKKYEEIENKEK